jgi:hypothetical protein
VVVAKNHEKSIGEMEKWSSQFWSQTFFLGLSLDIKQDYALLGM